MLTTCAYGQQHARFNLCNVRFQLYSSALAQPRLCWPSYCRRKTTASSFQGENVTVRSCISNNPRKAHSTSPVTYIFGGQVRYKHANMRFTTQLKAVLNATKEAAAAIRCLARTRRDGSPSAVLQLYQDLVLNRNVNSLFFTRSSRYLHPKLKRFHTTEIKLAMGVPVSTFTSEIYAEAEISTVPITDISYEHAICQHARLHMTK